MIEKTNAAVANVTAAIQRASASTGADFDYLMKTAARESSMDPNAHAGTSSASGLYQFIDQTWLGMIKQHGAEHGLQAYADQISQGKNGHYSVADRQTRRDILALRYDPEISATMAAEYTKESAAALKPVLGRAPNPGELYAAHFMGAGGAIDLIKAAQAGQTNAADLFPDEAGANRSIFYTKSGTQRSAAEVLAVLNDKQNDVVIPTKIPDTKPPVELAALRRSITEDGATNAKASPALASRGSFDMADAPVALATNDSGSTGGAPSRGSTYAPSTVTPFMAQLLASLDPIPDRARDALFRPPQTDSHDSKASRA